LDLYEVYQNKIADCDLKIETHMRKFESKIDPRHQPLPAPKRGKRPHSHAPRFDLRTELYRISGTDLTRIDGIDVSTAQTIISEIGLDMNRWPTEKQFSSWLGLSPDHRITGGKVVKRGTQHVVNRASNSLRMSAVSLRQSQSALGANYRRLQSRLGAPKAITAMAHKLARLVYRMLKYGQRYVDKGLKHYEERFQRQRKLWLEKQAKELNFQLVPVPATK